MDELFGFSSQLKIRIEIIDKSRTIGIKFGFGAKFTKLKRIRENKILEFDFNYRILITLIKSLMYVPRTQL